MNCRGTYTGRQPSRPNRKGERMMPVRGVLDRPSAIRCARSRPWASDVVEWEPIISRGCWWFRVREAR